MADPSSSAAEASTNQGESVELSKAQLKKRAQKEEKERKKAEKAAIEAEKRMAKQQAALDDQSAGSYGKLPLNQSQERTGRARLSLSSLQRSDIGQTVVFRARLTSSRIKGKVAFLDVRQRTHSVQVYIPVSKNGASQQMINWIAEIPAESIVLIEGIVGASEWEIKGATVKDMEIKGEKVYLIASPEGVLPFDLGDASRAESEYQKEDVQYNRVLLDHRLNNRVLDLRTPANQAIFSLQAAVADLFASYLRSQRFTEIHSPKLQGAATESGASVFKVGYFKGDAYLAQSPQLAKQMCIAADFERVFEIGPVFRAENSLTHRHLTEFVGVDLEMAIEEHYHEVIDLLDETLKAVFRGLRDNYRTELELVRQQFPVDDFRWREGPEGTLKMSFKEAVDLLVEDGVDRSELDDISTANEKRLGSIVKGKYDTDYFIVDKFPLHLRPFYTMPDPTDPTLSNAYDFFMRGEEILSGGQRIHCPSLLVEQMGRQGIDPASMQGYLNAFKLGCPPHGGGGIGLERVLMLFLKLGDIRRASLFPRDPKRLSP